MPSRNFTPSITFASHWKPRSRRQFFSALMPSLKIIESIPSRVRHPLVRSVRCRMVVLRTAHRLLLARVSPRHLRRALSELVRQLPGDRPLSGVRIVADGRHVVVRQGRTAWQPESGQVVFSFAVDELTRGARHVVAVRNRCRRPGAKPAPPPRGAGAWFEHALAREQCGDLAGACAAYQQAVELDPALADAYINFGRLTHLRGNAAEVVRLYHLALASAPEDHIAHYNLAIALEDQGRTGDALAHYRRAADLDPHSLMSTSISVACSSASVTAVKRCGICLSTRS
jgi:tetratricopeptide (TPR) repeat protein